MARILRYYYDTNCKKIDEEYKTYEDDTHDELAANIINANPELKKEFDDVRKHGYISESVFLVMKGYIYVGGTNINKMSAMFSSISLNDNTKKLMSSLKEEGYFSYDIIRSELKDEQQKQIINWYKNKMSREEIINKVMKEMLILLAPKQKKCEQDDMER